MARYSSQPTLPAGQPLLGGGAPAFGRLPSIHGGVAAQKNQPPNPVTQIQPPAPVAATAAGVQNAMAAGGGGMPAGMPKMAEGAPAAPGLPMGAPGAPPMGQAPPPPSAPPGPGGPPPGPQGGPPPGPPPGPFMLPSNPVAEPPHAQTYDEAMQQAVLLSALEQGQEAKEGPTNMGEANDDLQHDLMAMGKVANSKSAFENRLGNGFVSGFIAQCRYQGLSQDKVDKLVEKVAEVFGEDAAAPLREKAAGMLGRLGGLALRGGEQVAKRGIPTAGGMAGGALTGYAQTGTTQGMVAGAGLGAAAMNGKPLARLIGGNAERIVKPMANVVNKSSLGSTIGLGSDTSRQFADKYFNGVSADDMAKKDYWAHTRAGGRYGAGIGLVQSTPRLLGASQKTLASGALPSKAIDGAMMGAAGLAGLAGSATDFTDQHVIPRAQQFARENGPTLIDWAKKKLQPHVDEMAVKAQGAAAKELPGQIAGAFGVDPGQAKGWLDTAWGGVKNFGNLLDSGANHALGSIGIDGTKIPGWQKALLAGGAGLGAYGIYKGSPMLGGLGAAAIAGGAAPSVMPHAQNLWNQHVAPTVSSWFPQKDQTPPTTPVSMNSPSITDAGTAVTQFGGPQGAARNELAAAQGMPYDQAAHA